MGQQRGDRFARWFVALPKGRKFILSAVMASTAILTPAVLLTPTQHYSDKISPSQFEFTCEDNRLGDHKVSVDLPTDPNRINEMNAHPEQFVALFRSVCPSY